MLLTIELLDILMNSSPVIAPRHHSLVKLSGVRSCNLQQGDAVEVTICILGLCFVMFLCKLLEWALRLAMGFKLEDRTGNFMNAELSGLHFNCLLALLFSL